MLALRLSRRLVVPRAIPRTRWASTAASGAALRGLKSLNADDLAHFSKILPASSIISTLPPVKSAASELDIYNDDWMGKYHGQSTTVLKPKTTQQVADIVRWCNEKRIGLVPQGGNTGLVGGSIPLKDELIISLANMNQVRSFDPISGILVADAGCILQSLSDYIAPHGHIMPLDLGAKGSCQIGGNVSTNAGGLRLLRYGSLHGSVLGLEVVLPDGTILDQLSTLRKDNTGYDLKQLFIGAEGTLGIVTGVSILTAAAPQSTNNVILALPSFDNVQPLFKAVKQQLSEILSAFEFIDRTAYDLAVKHGQGRALSDEDIEGAECFVLVETSGGKREHDEEKLNSLLESLLEADEPLINTGVLSQNPAQFASLWALREGVTEAVSKEGKAYKYDISIPLSKFEECVNLTREHLREKGVLREDAVTHVLGYGHVGDGNLHLNIVAKEYSDEVTNALEPFVYELVAKYRGSVSAEHGIGSMKTHALPYTKDAVSIGLMKRIKNLFDPNGIMNPGKVLE
ncbi:FAD-binding domain-containing protein [Schizophyllum commune Tattone D]|nr:FAD-binding domain-containing protein [Schizophyllum commune Tattone D]